MGGGRAMDFNELVKQQRACFATGATRTLEKRLAVLEKLQSALKDFQPRIIEALEADLNKSAYEAYLTELGIVYKDLKYAIRHLKKWSKSRRVPGGIFLMPSKCRMEPEPYGVVLIVSPWNYPVNLSLLPLIGAVAAGNCVTLKPSGQTPHTTAILSELIAAVFPAEYVTLVSGTHDQCAGLIEQPWDYIFFTGSQAGGQAVMRAAAENLIPVTLELGGKNPTVIDPTCNLKLAAKRIAYSKCLNAGQTCVAPDYVLIHESIRDDFVEHYRKAISKFFPKGNMSNMTSIINDRHFKRLLGLIENGNAPISGDADPDLRMIPPAVIVDVDPYGPVMQQEVFGPVLPLITWTDLNWCVDYIHTKGKPLALYLFTEDEAIAHRLMNACSSGAVFINDCMLQAASHRIPFGGVGQSGMGAYHGKASFDTFTHYRPVLRRKKKDLPVRYYPFNKLKMRILKMFVH